MQRKSSLLELSVIIPCFNVSKYLKQCVQSVVCQTELDCEIILIDDGSTDGTTELCDELKRQNTKVKVIHQKNSGVSAARNAGLKVAAGAYIMFVDADDTLEQNAFKILSEKIKSKPVDILFFGYNVLLLSGEKIKSVSSFCKEEIVYINDFLKFFATHRDDFDTFYLLNSACGKMISKNVLQNFRFDTNVKIGEDYLFNLDIFSNANSFLFVQNCLYNYIKRKSSATTRKKDFADLKDTLKSCLATREFYVNHKLLKYKKHLNNYLHIALYNFLKMYVESGNPLNDLKKLTRQEKQLLTIPVLFSNGFHPREILFLMKCKMAML